MEHKDLRLSGALADEGFRTLPGLSDSTRRYSATEATLGWMHWLSAESILDCARSLIAEGLT